MSQYGQVQKLRKAAAGVGSLIERNALLALQVDVAEHVFVAAFRGPADAARESFVACDQEWFRSSVITMSGSARVLVHREIAGERNVILLQPIDRALDEQMPPT